jgi:hypothetical protein
MAADVLAQCIGIIVQAQQNWHGAIHRHKRLLVKNTLNLIVSTKLPLRGVLNDSGTNHIYPVK